MTSTQPSETTAPSRLRWLWAVPVAVACIAGGVLIDVHLDSEPAPVAAPAPTAAPAAAEPTPSTGHARDHAYARVYTTGIRTRVATGEMTSPVLATFTDAQLLTAADWVCVETELGTKSDGQMMSAFLQDGVDPADAATIISSARALFCPPARG